MAPQVKITSSVNDVLSFTLSGVNVSVANALRRTMLSDINSIVFRTSPHEKSKATIYTNTTRLNNEIIKMRLSCIPIHIKDVDTFPIDKYRVEVNVENTTDMIMFVTTKDFVVIDKTTDKPVDSSEIFPMNDQTRHYIDFVRLRPKVSDELPGEKIHMSCDLSIGNAKQDAAFNMVSTCAYGMTPDEAAVEDALAKKRTEWKNEEKDVEFETKNWRLLDGMRFYKQDSFDFKLQSVGVFTNEELIQKAVEVLNETLKGIDTLIDTDKMEIKPSQSTMKNSYDIILDNEDYTIGKTLEYYLYAKYYEMKVLTYCGFKKMHPHDSYSIIRIAYENPVDLMTIKGHLKECIRDAIKTFGEIGSEFNKK